MLFSRTFFCRTAAVLALAASAACSSSDKTDPTPASPPGLSWTVDGVGVKTNVSQSQKNNGLLSVAGTVNPNGPATTRVMLEMPQAVGTYTFGPTSNASAIYSSTATTSAVYYAGGNSRAGTVTGAGTIVVTALTATNVTGTFTFTGIDTNTGESKDLSKGQFNVGL